jgi:hypothetical protein
MKRFIGSVLGFLTWLAVLWTIYEEQHHLALYLGDPEIALGTPEYLDLAVGLVLLLYAIYEIFHAIGATSALDRTLAAHPAIDALTLTPALAAALGWGIYRDLGHFQHLYLGAEGTLPFGDDFDELAAAFLALRLLKTGHHALHAVKALARIGRRR